MERIVAQPGLSQSRPRWLRGGTAVPRVGLPYRVRCPNCAMSPRLSSRASTAAASASQPASRPNSIVLAVLADHHERRQEDRLERDDHGEEPERVVLDPEPDPDGEPQDVEVDEPQISLTGASPGTSRKSPCDRRPSTTS